MSGRERSHNVISRYTFVGFLKWLWLRATGRQVVVTGECLMCGRCCHLLNLSHSDKWIRSEREFRELVEEHPEYARFRHVGYTLSGIMTFECDYVSEDGLCGDYEDRPEFCRTYPEIELCFMGAGLPEHCGYQFEVSPSFQKLLKRSKANYKGNVPE